MPLNIKDEQVHQQARRLAELTGTSITGAVREAIAEKLERLEQGTRPTAPRSAEAILALGRECAALFPKAERSSDHAELYGDDGLPV